MDLGLVQDFILLYFCDWCESREIGGRGESKITNTNGGKLLHRPSFRYKKILDRVGFAFELCILLGEYDTKLYIMLLLLEWEEEIFFFVNV